MIDRIINIINKYSKYFKEIRTRFKYLIIRVIFRITGNGLSYE